MSLLLDNVDVSSKTIPEGAITQALTAFVKVIAQERSYLIADNKGLLSPFSTGGTLSDNRWANIIVQESNSANKKIFEGQIENVYQTIDERLGYSVGIQAREYLAVLLEFKVEENTIFDPDGTGYSRFQVNGNRTFGLDNFAISPTPAHTNSAVPKPCLCTFNSSLTPRYQVVDTSEAVLGANAGSSTAMWLDRGIEMNLIGNDPIRFTVYTTKTIPQAIKDALLAAGVPSARLGQSFDLLAAQDTTNTVRLFVLKENDITLSSHIAKLLEMGAFNLTLDQNGVIGILRTLAFTGTAPSEFITQNELFGNTRFDFDKSQLYIGYDLLYPKITSTAPPKSPNATNASEIAIESLTVSSALITKYRGKKRFQPVPINGNWIMSYPYMYASQSSAQYHGANVLAYYSTPRVRVKSQLKRSIHNSPQNLYQVAVGNKYALTLKNANGSFYYSEPSAIVEYGFDDSTQSWGVTLELTNKLSPELARTIDTPFLPVFTVAAISTGFTVTVTTASDNYYLYIYLEDKAYLVDRVLFSGTTKSYTGLNTGQLYYIRLTNAASNIESAFTSFQGVTAA